MRKFFALFLCALLSVQGALVEAGGADAILASLGPSASPNGACIGTSPCAATTLTDNVGNVWTLSATACDSGATPDCVWRNGSYAGFSSTVSVILWYGGKIYQFNGSQWFPCATNCTSGSSASVTWGPGQSDPRVTFGVKIVGDTFTDLFGNVLQFQGENVFGMAEHTPSMWDAFYNTTQANWVSIKNAWQMNIIRLDMNETDWNNNAMSPGTTLNPGGEHYQTIIATAVANITGAGMYVILDLHWAAPTAYGPATGQPGYIDANNGPTFWTGVANAFKGNAAVIFELFNEPYGDDSGNIPGSYTYLQNGGGPTTFYNQVGGSGSPVNTGVSFTVSGHQQLLNAIRATGATNVILWSCPIFDSYPAASLSVRPTDTLTPSQIGATVHYANGSNADYSNIQSANFPILMTEYYTMASRGGYPWAQTNHIGYVMCCGQNYNSYPTLVYSSGSTDLITKSPWSFNSSSVPWPPF